jgi:hypothetical protein
MNDTTGRTLRITAIVLMGLTGAMNILGGIGTVCAAFLTKQYPPMWVFYDYQLLYQALMITTIAIGLAGAWVTLALIRGGSNAYRNAVILLLVGSAVAATQYFASLAIRGKAVPANVKFYTNAFTLLVFLLLRLPGIRERVGFGGSEDPSVGSTAGGLTALVIGAVVLTTTLWAGPSHTYEGVNWAQDLRLPLLASGAVLSFFGLAKLAWGTLAKVMPSRSPALRSTDAE